MRSTSKDRTDIAALHGLPSVSEGNTSTWKKKPTPINPPKAGSMKDIAYTNPWGSNNGFRTNVGEAKRNANSGTAAQGGPKRTRKVDSMKPNKSVVSNRAKANTLVPTFQEGGSRDTKRPRLSNGASTAHAIDLTGDPSGDQSRLNATPGPSRVPHAPGKKRPELKVAKDGEYTEQLDLKMNLDVEDSDNDPIEMWSNPPSPERTKEKRTRVSTSIIEHQQRPGKVRALVMIFEDRADPLSQPSFKPKAPPSKEVLGQPARPQKPHPAQFGQSSSSKETKYAGKKRKRNSEEPFKLPIRKCIVKKAKKTSMYDDSLCVTFEKNSLKVFEGGRTLILDVDTRDYGERLLTRCDKEAQEAAFLWLRKPNDGKQPVFEDIALLLDCNHDDWDLETYKELSLWYAPKAEPPVSTVRGLWETKEADARDCIRQQQSESRRANITTSGKGESRPAQTKPASGKDSEKAFESAVPRPAATPVLAPQRDSPRPLLGNVYPGKAKGTYKLGQGPAQASTSKAVPNTATSPPPSKAELVAPLRRSGRQTTSTAPRNPADDEVILVFPPDVPGKVTITNADAGRLKPGEFLNDTLIEFGLKLWLKKLEGEAPELAKQVHVFSSFFYKKLNKKNHEEGFKSVRKWTSKFDLFEKKYIIVPINENMHWYLAVIYEPEHVLRPPPVEPTPPPSPSVSKLEDRVARDESVIIVSVSKSGSEAVPSPATSDGEAQDLSVQDIEVMNVDSPKTPAAQSPSEGRPPSPMLLSPEIPVFDSGRKAKSVEASTTSSTTGDEADVLNLVGMPAGQMVVDDETHTPEIPPEQFYGSTSTRSGKQYERPQRPARARGIGSRARETYRPDHTYVLTLDSLGSKHAYAAKQLSRYLIAEAKDKKGVDSIANIQTKSVNVPTQPNFCDCGLYLLHLAETFISDAQNLIRKDFETTARTPNAERQELWRDSKVPTMRAKLLSRIRTLSSQWKETQPKKSSSEDKEDIATKTGDDASDSDVDIIEIGPITKAKKTPKKQAAARLR